MAAGRIYCR